ncbi:MAG: ATP-binding protein [Gammaproteobacteria bacterium]|nr:ATP-binding protein [Gammaproteobacteria bacterium]
MTTNTTPQPLTPIANKHVLLVTGESSVGKSMSLHGLKNPKGVLYLNCEIGKPLPFTSEFMEIHIQDPDQVKEIFSDLLINKDGKSDRYHTVVIDSLSLLMNLWSMLKIQRAPAGSDTRALWGQYKIFFEGLMYDYVSKCKQNVIFLCHLERVTHEDPNIPDRLAAAVQGALGKKEGVEAYFQTIIGVKQLPLDQVLIKNVDPSKSRTLRDFKNPMLKITEREEMTGLKSVFQTMAIYNASALERIRSPKDVFTLDETFTDNNIQYIIDKLNTPKPSNKGTKND